MPKLPATFLPAGKSAAKGRPHPEAASVFSKISAAAKTVIGKSRGGVFPYPGGFKISLYTFGGRSCPPGADVSTSLL